MTTPEETTAMEDTRARVPLNGKTVDLGQLASEVGTPLVASETEIVAADPASTVTAAQLAAAIDAHTPAPPEPDLVERIAAIEARLDKAANAAVTGDAAKLRDNLR